MPKKAIPLDYKIICEMVDRGTTVLDLGCGSGELLLLLSELKNAKGQGIELREEAICQCVEKGISVFHGDIERGLIEYPDKTFDYVILNQSMQEVKNVDYVVQEALRVGKKIIIGFPNFSFIKSRLRLFFCGKVPVTKSLPYRWYDTPNVHFLSIKDFRDYCKVKDIDVLSTRCLGKKGKVVFWPNLFALNAVFLLTRNGI
ncbi:MAG: methionine biosynthesis protein MetW [Candidatus Omnitrophica bacterium]|nr:methionine biosynthesis protein MetW [Candidatus Omnitrophota bacterium]